ncbi:MAG: hypothetical protein ACOYM3_02800 [Terrimicrobiaceae bacterium]
MKKQTSSQASKYSKPVNFQEFKKRVLSTLQKQEIRQEKGGWEFLPVEEGA